MPRRLLAHAALVILALSAGSTARAQSKQECLDAFVDAQHLHAAGRLLEARDRLQLCGSPRCPALVRADCAQRENAVLAALPTVTFAARDPSGQDVVDVAVAIDGRRVDDRLDGREVPLDPGVHSVRFESAGREPAELSIVVRAGEKNRIVSATLRPTGVPAAATVARPYEPAPAQATSRPIPWLVPVLGGAGVASLAAAALLYFPIVSRAHELRSSCAPACSPAEVDSLVVQRDASWLLAGVGGASLVGAAILLMLRPTVVVAPAPHGATLLTTARF